MKNQSLVLYSKFDNETGFDYIKPNNTEVGIRNSTQLVDTFDGPFSNPDSSYSTNTLFSIGIWLGYFKMSPEIDLTSFTLGFYLRVTGSEFVGIYRDWHDPGYRFTLTAANLDLELHIHNSSISWRTDPSYKDTITSFTFRNVFKAFEWQFVALTYDGARRQLKLYDETANVKDEYANVQIDQASTNEIGIGASFRFSDWKYFPRSSAIACFSLHNKGLPQMDIALLPCACQLKDRQYK